MLEGTEDEQYERRWEPVYPNHKPNDQLMEVLENASKQLLNTGAIIGNTALENKYTEEYWATAKRDSDKESVFVLLIVPGGVMEHSMLLTYTSGLGNTVLFKTSEDAFNHGSHYIDDPWQVVKL